MIAAAIDVGTNTTRLLVADVDGGRIQPLATDGVMTALGAGLERTGAIADEGLDLAARTVADMAGRARDLGAVRLTVACTAVARDADNADELLARLATASGVAPRVLSGGDEARLTYAGLVAGGAGGDLAAADLGGGSLELMGGRDSRLAWSTSLPVGVRRLTARHAIADPPEAAAWMAVADDVAALVAPVAADHPVAAMLATGGSASALGVLAGTDRLDGRALRRVAAILAAAASERVAAETGVEAARVRLCTAGAGALEGVRRAFGLDALEISQAGLREGLVLEATG